jgi:hypothetical protein
MLENSSPDSLSLEKMRILAVALACVVLVLSGIFHGHWTGRWGPSADLQRAASRCDDLPLEIGDWQGYEVEPDYRQLALAEVAGHVSRSYVNQRTGRRVSLLLLCGRPGPICVHTPDVCYRGSGYNPLGHQESWRADADESARSMEFATARFAKPGPAAEPLRLFWSWSNSGRWQAPQSPRVAFVCSGVLYKLYVARSMARADQPLDAEPCCDFIRVLMPRLNASLFPTPLDNPQVRRGLPDFSPLLCAIAPRE